MPHEDCSLGDKSHVSADTGACNPLKTGFLINNIQKLSSGTMTLGSTQPLTKMSTRKFPGGKKRPASRADNLAAIYEPNV
jgi:hypothetical protein